MGNFTIKTTAENLSAYLHEIRNAYGKGATVADVLRNPRKAERLATIYKAVEDINEKLKR